MTMRLENRNIMLFSIIKALDGRAMWGDDGGSMLQISSELTMVGGVSQKLTAAPLQWDTQWALYADHSQS